MREVMAEHAEVTHAPSLTVREEELLGLLANGLTYQRAAALMGISVHTVRKHMDNIRDKWSERRLPALIRRWVAHRSGVDVTRSLVLRQQSERSSGYPIATHLLNGDEEIAWMDRRRDDFLDRVADVYRLRSPLATVTRVASPLDGMEYLRVSEANGEAPWVRPVGASETGVAWRDVELFAPVHARYHHADDRVVSELVYAGQRAADELIEAALARGIRLVTFREHQVTPAPPADEMVVEPVYDGDIGVLRELFLHTIEYMNLRERVRARSRVDGGVEPVALWHRVEGPGLEPRPTRSSNRTLHIVQWPYPLLHVLKLDVPGISLEHVRSALADEGPLSAEVWSSLGSEAWAKSLVSLLDKSWEEVFPAVGRLARLIKGCQRKASILEWQMRLGPPGDVPDVQTAGPVIRRISIRLRRATR